MIVVLIMVVAVTCVSVFVLSRIAPIEDFFHWSPDRWEHDEYSRSAAAWSFTRTCRKRRRKPGEPMTSHRFTSAKRLSI